MAVCKILSYLLVFVFVESYVINQETKDDVGVISNSVAIQNSTNIIELDENSAENVFDGVYVECFLYLSYTCIQKKTLLYLKKLNDLREISVLGQYVKFVKTFTQSDNEIVPEQAQDSAELSTQIDAAVDKFFENHVLRFKALGKDFTMPRSVDEFVGRKKRKGGGGGGGHHDGGDDGGKKKMMMMAMMCMKMKLMMMVPAMMGMMGMMSFKGMMFSMMSFMMSKMMLLMKILEKKGSLGGGGDMGWAAGGGGGGAWMPAGGQDYGGGAGGGGGGYDANGQWQSRSIPETTIEESDDTNMNNPEISFVKPTVRYNNIINPQMKSNIKNINDDINYTNEVEKPKSRKKRGIMDLLQNAYMYWISKMIGVRRQNNLGLRQPMRYKYVNGVKYVYYPIRFLNAAKTPKALQHENTIKTDESKTPQVITVEDFNKGEIVESPEISSRMNKDKINKIKKMKDDVEALVDDNPWE